MIRALASLLRNRRGAAAAEMAMVAPLLVVIMFGSAEMGKFFWDEHVVIKAVRDGARYATRQKFSQMPCGGTATNEAAIKNVVRYGVPVVTTEQPRLFYWTDDSTITVTIDCYDNAGTDGARVYDGIYSTQTNVPRVIVTAEVPYSPIIASIGVDASSFELNAKSEGTVFGL